MVVATRTVAPCYVCILAPEVRCARTALNYQPFGNRPLGAILKAATDSARHSAGVMGALIFDHYEVSEDFFYGETLTSEAVERLASVPSAIVDCDIFHTPTPAAHDAHRALYAFSKIEGKVLYSIKHTDHCSEQVIPPALLINSDIQLIHVLEAHLWSRQFTEMMIHHDRR
jgi:hypothetical protein